MREKKNNSASAQELILSHICDSRLIGPEFKGNEMELDHQSGTQICDPFLFIFFQILGPTATFFYIFITVGPWIKKEKIKRRRKGVRSLNRIQSHEVSDRKRLYKFLNIFFIFSC